MDIVNCDMCGKYTTYDRRHKEQLCWDCIKQMLFDKDKKKTLDKLKKEAMQQPIVTESLDDYLDKLEDE